MTITAELFDGTKLEFPDGTDPAVISRVAKDQTARIKAASAPDQGAGQIVTDPATGAPVMQQPPRADAPASPAAPYQATPSSVMGQAGAGSQIGIAQGLGFPVDAVAQAMGVQDPFGGSASIARGLEPFRAGIGEPQTRGERVARRVGQEVGTSAAMAPAAFALPAVLAAPGAFAGTEAASALGAGGGAALANELAPGSAAADVIGALAGGLTAGGLAGRMLGTGGRAPEIRGGIDDQRALATDRYATVRADPARIDPQSVDDMVLDIGATMRAERINPRLHPSAAAAFKALRADRSKLTRIEDIEEMRRYIQRNVSSSAIPEEKRLGQIMVNKMTDYLDGLTPAKMQRAGRLVRGGGDPAPVVADLLEGRAAHRRVKAAEVVQEATSKAQRRAASTGSGGNEINAIRQNIRAILDSPSKRRSFKPEELAAMERVVMGTKGGNIARSMSRFAPTSGGLSAMLGVGGVMASPAVALPIMGLAEAGKYLGGRSIRTSADELVRLLAPDRVMRPGALGMTPAIQALLAGRQVVND